jgi:hypothetical protein
VSSCDAASESSMLSMLAPITATLASAAFLIGGVGIEFLPGYPKCSPGESHRSLFMSDDCDVSDVDCCGYTKRVYQ